MERVHGRETDFQINLPNLVYCIGNRMSKYQSNTFELQNAEMQMQMQSANWGPRSRVFARKTLRSDPHRG